MGELKDAFDGIIAKMGTGKATSNAEMMVDVLDGVLEVEGWDLIGIGETLAESLMNIER